MAKVVVDMSTIEIGEKVIIEAEIVDYNEGLRKVKVRIPCLNEDRKTEKFAYGWLDVEKVGFKNE